MSKKDLRSELAIKRDEWFESNEGSRCSDSSTLGIMDTDKFLRNRLECAFLAGALANEQVKQEFCDKFIKT